MSAKKNKSAIDIILDKGVSQLAKNKAMDKLWEESKGDFNYQCKEGYRFVDILILYILDYNGIGHSEKLISKFVNSHEKDFMSIIENDVTEDNPIALIMRTRSSSILLKALLNKIDFSKENIEAHPGLKMLTTTFKSITPNPYHYPSDFILELEKCLSKYEHLKKFVGELKSAYAISNLFLHKELNDDIKKEFTLISQNLLNYHSIPNDGNPNQFFIKVINDGLNYIKQMSPSEVSTFKSKVEKELICDFSFINFLSLETFNNRFNTDIQEICGKLELDISKININYSGKKTLEEYNAHLIIKNTIKILTNLIDINNININEEIIKEKVLDIEKNHIIQNFKTYVNNLNTHNEKINIDNKLLSKLDDIIDNIEYVNELNFRPKKNRLQKQNEYLSMNKLYISSSDPFVKDIFKKIDEHFQKNKVSNINIVNQISAIVDLKGVFPNRDNVLNNINKNCIDLLENKLVLTTYGEIIKNPSINNEKEAFLYQQNKKLIAPLINEIQEIKSLIQKYFVIVDEFKREDKNNIAKPK